MRDNEHFISAIDLIGSRSDIDHWIIGLWHFSFNEQKEEKLGKRHFIIFTSLLKRRADRIERESKGL